MAAALVEPDGYASKGVLVDAVLQIDGRFHKVDERLGVSVAKGFRVLFAAPDGAFRGLRDATDMVAVVVRDDDVFQSVCIKIVILLDFSDHVLARRIDDCEALLRLHRVYVVTDSRYGFRPKGISDDIAIDGLLHIPVSRLHYILSILAMEAKWLLGEFRVSRAKTACWLRGSGAII